MPMRPTARRGVALWTAGWLVLGCAGAMAQSAPAPAAPSSPAAPASTAPAPAVPVPAAPPGVAPARSPAIPAAAPSRAPDGVPPGTGAGVQPSATARIVMERRRTRTYAGCNRGAQRRGLYGGDRRRFITRCRLGYDLPPRRQ